MILAKAIEVTAPLDLDIAVTQDYHNSNTLPNQLMVNGISWHIMIMPFPESHLKDYRTWLQTMSEHYKTWNTFCFITLPNNYWVAYTAFFDTKEENSLIEQSVLEALFQAGF